MLLQSNGFFATHHLQPLVFEKFCGSRFGENLPFFGAFMYLKGPFIPVGKDCCFQIVHPKVGTDLCCPCESADVLLAWAVSILREEIS